ncbi:MAG: hypothetical protein JKY12_00700 [Sneathiella sp.]|nr:hypothetical protein [Sneathiella sp.]
MGTDFSSTELILLWLMILIVIVLAMALYVMRKKAMSLFTRSDSLAERVRLLEGELESKEAEKVNHEKNTLSLKSALMDAKAQRDDFIDLLNMAPFAIWHRDEQSRIVWHNKKYEQIVGERTALGDMAELVSSREPEQARKLAAEK